MSLMRHTDTRLTMKVYTDPRVFDLAVAMAKLPSLDAPPDTLKATGTNDAVEDIKTCNSFATKIATTGQAALGCCLAVSGKDDLKNTQAVRSSNRSDLQQSAGLVSNYTKKRVKGVEPSTFTLAT